MKPMSRRLICGAIVCGAGWLACPIAGAQSLGGGLAGMGGAGMGAAGSGMGAAGMGMGLGGATMAGIGMTGAGMATASAGAISPGVQSMSAAGGYGSLTGLPLASPMGSAFNSPMASPLIYGAALQGPISANAQANMYYSQNGIGNTQLGLMMLSMMQQNGGVGSGQLSGVRGDPRQGLPSSATDPRNAKQRAAAKPGGLAGRYFNRTAVHTSYPKKYYKRPSRYYP